MQEDIIQRYRMALVPRLRDYLREEKRLGLDGDFDCAVCGGRAYVSDESLWYCPDCGHTGGLLDLAAMRWPRRGEWDRIRSLCDLLKVHITELETFSSRDLAQMELRPREYLVEGLLPSQGVTLLAAPAKTGKSWLVLQLAAALVKGEPFLEQPTRRCRVLYLSLEDYPLRLMERCRALDCLGSPDLHFSTRAELLGKGFEEGIDEFLQREKGIGLIIVDTLQKIREVGREAPSYGMDYKTMDRLKELAERYGIAVLLVHHTNKKEETEDAMNQVSGTMAIIGGVDGIWLLRRRCRLEGRATMQVTGRDTDDKLLSLEFDRENCRWRFLGFEAGSEPPAGDALDPLLDFLAEGEEWIGTATELAEELGGCTARGISSTLKRREKELADWGLLWELRRTPKRRELHLYRERRSEPRPPEEDYGFSEPQEEDDGFSEPQEDEDYGFTEPPEDEDDGENPFLFAESVRFNGTNSAPLIGETYPRPRA